MSKGIGLTFDLFLWRDLTKSTSHRWINLPSTSALEFRIIGYCVWKYREKNSRPSWALTSLRYQRDLKTSLETLTIQSITVALRWTFQSNCRLNSISFRALKRSKLFTLHGALAGQVCQEEESSLSCFIRSPFRHSIHHSFPHFSHIRQDVSLQCISLNWMAADVSISPRSEAWPNDPPTPHPPFRFHRPGQWISHLQECWIHQPANPHRPSKHLSSHSLSIHYPSHWNFKTVIR